jgi:hypothetical protein
MRRGVTITAEQADFCRAILCRDLMRLSSLIASNKDASGIDLTIETTRELMGFSSQLQLMLLTLGMTSEELEKIVKDFGSPQ